MNVGQETVLAGYHTIIGRINSDKSTVLLEYLAYFFASDLHRNQIRTGVSGIKVYSITQQMLKNTKILVPTLAEQKRIATELDAISKQNAEIVENKRKVIIELQRYRKSVVYESVTGKKKV